MSILNKYMKSVILLIAVFTLFQSGNVFAEDDSLDMKNANYAEAGMITGGQPSQKDIKVFAQKGIKRIINLRGIGEFDGFDEADVAKASGIEYVQLPISGKDDINKENAIKLDQLIKESKGDVVIHCASGNRVGALLALREFYVNKKKPADAIEFGKKAGMTRLTPVVVEKLRL